MKTLLGVLAATIRGSLTLPRQTPHGLEGTSQLGDVTRPAAAEYQIFMSRGEPPLMTTLRTFCTFPRELSSRRAERLTLADGPTCPRGVEPRERTADDDPHDDWRSAVRETEKSLSPWPGRQNR